MVGWHWDANIEVGEKIYEDAYKTTEKYLKNYPWANAKRKEYDAICKYNRGNGINLFNDRGEININDIKTREFVIIGFRYACNWTPNIIDGYAETDWSLPEKNSGRWLKPDSVEYHMVYQDWPK